MEAVEAGEARAVEAGARAVAGEIVLPASLVMVMNLALPGLLASLVTGLKVVEAVETGVRDVLPAMMELLAREVVEEGASSSAMMAPEGGEWVQNFVLNVEIITFSSRQPLIHFQSRRHEGQKRGGAGRGNWGAEGDETKA